MQLKVSYIFSIVHVLILSLQKRLPNMILQHSHSIISIYSMYTITLKKFFLTLVAKLNC